MTDRRRETPVDQTPDGGPRAPAAVGFLTSPEVGHTTGRVIAVNGGASRAAGRERRSTRALGPSRGLR
ncbi:hypothetical protein [Saccharothrix algeriensis]|uniref:Uncharacterized protein n=1 Tax=Saccharothrix algeriensis TaxID=173560 RepID=A0A8T8HTK0_9PSEU|nr:hypothetical protein [Saccharothrix algeriensis]MBM7813345.1 hypothetical protein [Saccharothrix algeriensis]QTR01883.1 hypothetical protein J7S33_21805 [Saccharothrix algeriensis]